MGITKTEGFNPKVTEIAKVYKALGHPARWAIMQHVASSPSCICNDLVDVLPLAQPTISQHLVELKKVGLIKGKVEGKNVCYCINEERWNEVKQALEEISHSLINRESCC